jgi:hypothetical protein
MLGRRRVLLGALAAAIIAAGGITTSVASASGRTTTQRAHPGSVSNATVGAPTAVFVKTNSADITSTSTTLTAIPHMSVTFTVGRPFQLIMNFTDEAGCSGTTAGDWCDVEILVDGVEALPGAGSDYAIDTSDGTGTFKWIGAGLDRSKFNIPAGTHTVSVVFAPVFSGDTAWSGENQLEVWVF